MLIVNIHKAKTQLSRLIEEVLSGREVLIAKAGKPVVRMEPVHKHINKRESGKYKGKIKMAEDFDQLPEDIMKAFSGKSDESFD